MKNAKNLLLSLILALASSCEVEHAPPAVATCISNGDGSASCADTRRPKHNQTYQQSNTENMVCTSPEDYKSAYNYCSDLREDLIKCERKKGKK